MKSKHTVHPVAARRRAAWCLAAMGMATSLSACGGGDSPAASSATASAVPAPAPAPAPPPASGPGPSASPAPAPGPSPTPPAPAPTPAGGVDTSSPDHVIGSGSAASCTEAALRSAVAAGGVIVFQCGSAPHTFKLNSPLVAPTDKDTVIDGGDRIVLDGQGLTQILRAYHADFRVNDHYLAVQRLSMINGRDTGSNYVARNGGSSCAWGYKDGGGGAINTRDLNVKVHGVTFENNRGPDLGPDVAGGAIYMMGAKSLSVTHSSFRNNTASNGGAIGVLHVATTISDSVFEHNRAIGMLANFANATDPYGEPCPNFNHEGQGGAGGLGGAFYSDGQDEGDSFTRVRIAHNTANDLGGGVFRSAYWGMLAGVAQQTIRWTAVTLEANATAKGGGGGAYLNNSLFVMRDVGFVDNAVGDGDGGGLKITGTTVDAADLRFTGNAATWGGGVAHWGGGPAGTGTAVRSTYAGNAPQDSVGDFPR